MTYKELTPELKKQISQDYLNNTNICELVKKYELCKDLVYQVLFETKAITAIGQYKPRYNNRHYDWKQAVADYYLTHSRFQTKDFFRTSSSCVDRVIDEFGLPRRTHAEELTFYKIQQFGSLEAYKKHMIAECKKTSMERYGVDNYAKTQEFREKSAATCLMRYGVSNPMQCNKIKETLSATCKDRFGVAWACMRKEARFSTHGSDSGPNLSFYDKVIDKLTESKVTREFCLDRFSYDFKIGNVLVEIDPSSTHNSTWGIYGEDPMPKDYHYRKTKTAENYGYRCIHVWDWDDVDKIINQLIPRKIIYARNTCVKEIEKSTAQEYIQKYHIQGYIKDSIRIGLYYQEELVSVMTFGKPRYNKNYEYELLRYCAHCDVIGGAEKLFKYFIRNYCPNSVISYCDKSKFQGKTYQKLGFVLLGCSISKHWYSMKTGKHITDNLLRKHGFDQLMGNSYGTFGKGTSNEQLMKEHGFVEIYDCGQATYVWQSS